MNGTIATPSGAEPQKEAPHQGEVICCCFVPGRPWVVSGGWDGQVIVWDRHTGAVVQQWKAGNKPVTAITTSPDGSRILTGSMDGLLAQWDVNMQKSISVFLAHTRTVSAIQYSPNGRLLVTSSWDGNLTLWRTDREREGRTLAGHHDIVTGCCFSPDGKSVYSWSHDGTLRLWDVAHHRQEARWSAHAYRVSAGSASPDGRWFASGNMDGSVIIWEAASRKEFAQYAGHQAEITGCCFSPDAELLFSISSKGDVIIHPLPDLRHQTGRETGWPIRCAALSASGDLLVFGTQDGWLRLLPLTGMGERAACVTPVETYEPRASKLASMLGSHKMVRVLRAGCPSCGHTFEITPEQGAELPCPQCRRGLRINPFTTKP